jgi:putative transposase
MAELPRVIQTLRARFAQAAELLEAAAEDLLAHLHLPHGHRRRLHSTDPLERLHTRRSSAAPTVVGISLTEASLARMVATLLQELDHEWQVADRPYFSAGSMAHADELGRETPREYWKRSREQG